MFDTIAGLPIHALVVHGVVVLLPIMALATVIAALRPWPRKVRGSIVVLNALMLGASYVATQSGEQLRDRLPATPAISSHEEIASLVPYGALGLFVASLLLLGVGANRGGRLLAAVVTVVAAGATLFLTIRAGHTGAVAVWSDIVKSTN